MSNLDNIKAVLEADTDGMLTYEYLANNVDMPDVDINGLAEGLCHLDMSGQFTASAARFLHAVNAGAHAQAVALLVAATIDHDRERRYLPDLMLSIYGPDYEEHATELAAADNNFRRMYKRLHAASNAM